MSKKFRHIPSYTGSNQQDVLRSLVDATRHITSQTADPIIPLATTATNAEIIAKINELIARIQGD